MDTLALLAATNNLDDKYSIKKNFINSLFNEEPDNYILKEILGARADNKNHKFQAQAEIAALGTMNISSDDYASSPIHQGQALNTLDVFLVGAGFKSNLVTGDLMMRQGMESSKVVAKIR